MKLLYLRTTSFQCDPHVGSLVQVAEKKNWDVSVRDYFAADSSKLFNFQEKFDYIIWLGSVDSRRPSAEMFRALRSNGSKLIFLCPEASNEGWWPLIREFHKHESFDLIVNLDGIHPSIDVPVLTTLAIFDQRPYANPKPWHERSIDIGFCGGGTLRPDRSSLPQTLREKVIGKLRTLPNFKELEFKDQCGTYQKYADFMMDCKIAINCSGSSSDWSYHVKGRVIEAGLAGCLLFEDSKSPLRHWIAPSAFITYDDLDTLPELIRLHLMHADDSAQIAAHLSQEVRRLYPPELLWDIILGLQL